MSLALAVQHWPVEKLIPYATNARTHSDEQIAQIAASIAEFGFVNPVLVGPDGVLIAGHARLLAARKLGMVEVPVIILEHLTKTQRRALALADNRLPLNAGWDEELLRLELEALREDDFNLDLIGFSDQELESLLTEPHQIASDGDEDAAPEPPEAPVTARGDLWILGRHRLLVGDATAVTQVEKLMAGEKAAMVWTDPPYNIDYEGRTKDKLRIQNDSLGDEFFDFLRAACANLIAASEGAIYICMSSSELHTLYRAFTEAGGHWSTFIIWGKNHFTLGWGDYRRQYEPLLYGWPEGSKHYWCGARDQGDLWLIDRPAANRDHPTMKPLELVERALANNSRKGDVVLDLFGGSGTTMIACERLGRQARLMEIDPRYADVIIRRWMEFAGKAAVLEGDGRTFEEVTAERGKEKKAPPIDQATPADNA
jgi:DNA modification methylase